jgi:hypothetical protein
MTTVGLEQLLAEGATWLWKKTEEGPVRHLVEYVDLNLVNLCERKEIVAALFVMQPGDALATMERRWVGILNFNEC